MKTTYISGVFTTHFAGLFRAMLFFCLFLGSSYAKAQNAVSLEDFQNLLQKENPQEGELVEHLLNDLTSVAYVDEKGVKIYLEDEQPVQKIFTTPSFLQRLYAPEESLLFAVILRVSLQNENDLKGNIDLSKLEALPNLKYVHILSEVDCDISSVVEQMLGGTNEKLTVFYEISIPK